MTDKLVIGGLTVVIFRTKNYQKFWSKYVVCISISIEKISQKNENVKLILLTRTPALLWKYNVELSENIFSTVSIFLNIRSNRRIQELLLMQILSRANLRRRLFFWVGTGTGPFIPFGGCFCLEKSLRIDIDKSC